MNLSSLLMHISEDLELEPLTPAIFLRDITEDGVHNLDNIDAVAFKRDMNFK